MPVAKNPVGRPRKKHAGGRPTVMTKDVLRKLDEAFMIGCSDLEACFVAGISKTALYEYQDRNPEFADRKAGLKENPTYIARKCVFGEISQSPELALKYLERKKKDEFSVRTEAKIEAEVTHIEKMSDDELDKELADLDKD